MNKADQDAGNKAVDTLINYETVKVRLKTCFISENLDTRIEYLQQKNILPVTKDDFWKFVLCDWRKPNTHYLYINSGWWYLCHVPCTFLTVNTHANVFFVFLPGGISKECRHIVSANCDWGEFTLPISSVHGSFGEQLGRPKRAHGSHNDVRLLCWPNLGCESPLAETPKGSLCWENLCGWGCLVGGALTGVTAHKENMHVYLQVQICGESAKELHLHSVAY